VAKLLQVLIWPGVVIFALLYFGPAFRGFIAAASEIKLSAGGLEASARRRFNSDETSRKLHDFWKPDGKVSRSNAAEIARAMRELGIPGSVPWLISAGSPEDRTRVAARLSSHREEV
jgi:hypothetical protein